MIDKIIRRKELERAIGKGRSAIYDAIKHGQFPRPIKLGEGRAVGWLGSEIEAWLANRVSERDALLAGKGAQQPACPEGHPASPSGVGEPAPGPTGERGPERPRKLAPRRTVATGRPAVLKRAKP